LAAGDYAVDDRVASAWMDINNVPHPAGQDTFGLLHGNTFLALSKVNPQGRLPKWQPAESICRDRQEARAPSLWFTRRNCNFTIQL
jgi:hypothetical protein